MSWPHQHWQGFFGVAYILLLGNSVCAVLMCLQWTSQQVAGWLYNLSVLINLNPMDCHHWQFFTRSVNYNLSIATMKHWPLWFLQSLLVASSFPSNPFCGGHVEVYTDVVLSLQTQWHDSENGMNSSRAKTSLIFGLILTFQKRSSLLGSPFQLSFTYKQCINPAETPRSNQLFWVT